jgi:hypothetical protein
MSATDWLEFALWLAVLSIVAATLRDKLYERDER